MRVLLVNNGGVGSSEFSMKEARFPIGLGYLSAMLKQKGHETFLVDRFCDHGAWVDDPNEFDFVGVYTSTPCFDDALQILELLNDYAGPIAFGGPHTTAFPRTIPPRVDYVVQGEAEHIINDLVEGRYPRGSLIKTQRIEDLDALPPARPGESPILFQVLREPGKASAHRHDVHTQLTGGHVLAPLRVGGLDELKHRDGLAPTSGSVEKTEGGRRLSFAVSRVDDHKPRPSVSGRQRIASRSSCLGARGPGVPSAAVHWVSGVIVLGHVANRWRVEPMVRRRAERWPRTEERWPRPDSASALVS